MTTTENYKAFIASNEHTPYFDFSTGHTEAIALASLKRKYKNIWNECVVWTGYIHEDGQVEYL